jgi:hypothetical protein
MSREFGEYVGGYFHHKIANATNDLHNANTDIHKKLIPFFKILNDVCWEISSVEAGDSEKYASISSLEDNIPLMIRELEKIQKELLNYET